MALKDILVCLDPTEAGERRLRLAAAIAREHHAHLSAAYLLSEAIPGVPPYEGAGIPASPSAPPTTSPAPSPSAELADIVEQRFRAEVQPHGIDGDWHLFGSGGSEELIALSRTMDLVVFGQARPITGCRPGSAQKTSSWPVVGQCSLCPLRASSDRRAGVY